MLPSEAQRGGSLAASENVLTGDMIAQHAYCPRRLHLLYAEARWADNEHTDGGRFVHRNTDRREQPLPAPDPGAPVVARSVTLESPELGLRAKLDLLEVEAGASVPVEYKKGRGPSSGGVYPPERMQVGLQGLLLRESGHACDHGVVYYAETKQRVRVDLDDALVSEVRREIEAARRVLALAESPSPLVDSPKCPSCSLVGICLPDETTLLAARGPLEGASTAEGSEGTTAVSPRSPTDDEPLRRLVPPRDDALPLYVQEQGATVGKRGETLVITLRQETLAEVRLLDVSQLVLLGSVMVTPAALQLLCEAGVPTLHFTYGHWFVGVTSGPTLRNAFDRAAQFARAADPSFRLALAKTWVAAKARNQRTLLRRNGPSEAPVLEELRWAIDAIDELAPAASLSELLGREGRAAALYFGAFASMLRPPEHAGDSAARLAHFDFAGRNRRPPRDPVNAMLSFGYALLAKEATVALLAAGLDPYWGFLHEPRHGRPALALDLMEEFRPLLVDSVVLTAINTGAVDAGCFERTSQAAMLNARGRKAFLKAYETRMDQLVTHPVFRYRVSWRRILSVQALLLSRVLRGTLPAYTPITTR